MTSTLIYHLMCELMVRVDRYLLSVAVSIVKLVSDIIVE